ncbi:MAG: 16S rRNA methyltransferase [Archaeoglobaceae archaeon]
MYSESTKKKQKHTLILLDSSLERIPSSISSHESVTRDAKKRGKSPRKIILDDSIHYPAISSLEDGKKKGRPDIVHFCLLSALDSPISADMDVYIHTLEDKIIWINSETRLPRNFNRFRGLMESLLEKQVIMGGDKTLMKVLDITLDKLLSSIQGSKIVMREKGGHQEDYLKDTVKSGEDITLGVGGFPHGDYRDSTLDILDKHGFIQVSLGERTLTSNYVLNRSICILEEVQV